MLRGQGLIAREEQDKEELSLEWLLFVEVTVLRGFPFVGNSTRLAVLASRMHQNASECNDKSPKAFARITSNSLIASR